MRNSYLVSRQRKIVGWLLFYCMGLVAPSALQAQTFVTIGTQGAQSGTSAIAPYNYFWESRRVQQVYTAAELAAAGLCGGTIITGLAWDISQAATSSLLNYQVRMAHTTATDAAAHNIAILTTVKTPFTFAPPTSTGFRQIDFDNNFIWNGTDNILVDVCWGVNTGWASNGQVWMYNTGTSNLTRNVTSGSSNQCDATTTVTRSGKARVRFSVVLPTLSATTIQGVTTAVSTGATNEQLLRIDINAPCTPPETVEGFTFNYTGTNPADITQFRLRRGADFATSTLVATGTLASFSSITPITLTPGANTFWLAVDVAGSATDGNIVDATCTDVSLGSGSITPTVTNPAGSRTIAAPMTYVSSTTTQTVTSDIVTKPATNQQIIGVQVVMSATGAPVNLTQLALSTAGSTAPATDIANAKVWYTGTSNTFAATTQFGTTVVSPNGAFNVNGSQPLANGTNYFWVTYDIPAGAVNNNVLDAQCTGLTINGVAYTPTVTNPAGNRKILVYCTPVYSTGCSLDDMINSFVLGTISNTNTGCTNVNATGYTVYPPSITTNLEVGQSYTASITAGAFGSQFYAIWIDLNQDGDFDDSGEFIGATSAPTAANATSTINFTVPAALSGATRLRVRGNYDAALTAGQSCSGLTFGEAEDYTVNITLPPCKPLPTLTVTSPTTATVAWANVPNPVTNYTFRYRIQGSPTWTSTTPATSPVALTGLINTVYEYEVIANGCTPGANTSGVLTFRPNDDCAGAIVLTPGTLGAPYSYISGSVAGAGNSGVAPVTGSCGVADDDVWFRFTATSVFHGIRVEATSGFNATFEVFAGTCNALLPAFCINNGGSGVAEETSVSGFTPGTTYYVRVYDAGTGAAPTTDFSIGVITPAPPANDNCAGAISLTPGYDYAYTNGTTYAATASGGAACTTKNPDDDVWFKFTATHTAHNVRLLSSSGFDGVLQIYSGSCGSLTQIICQDASNTNGVTETALLTGLTVGQTYFVRLYHGGVGAGSQGYAIAVATPNTQFTPLNYTVTRTEGVTYNSILATGSEFTWAAPNTSGDDVVSAFLHLDSLGFKGFKYQGVTVTGLAVGSNGAVSFVNGAGISFLNEINGTNRGLLAPLWDDWVTAGHPGGAPIKDNIKYQLTGTPGSQVLTIEFANLERFSNPTVNVNFQVKLYEGSSKIEYIYGNGRFYDGTLNTDHSYSLGMNGSNTNVTPGTVYITQRAANTNCFTNTTAVDNLSLSVTCNSQITFVPSGSFTNCTTAPTIPVPANNECVGATVVTLGVAPPSSFCDRNSSFNATLSQAGCLGTNADDDVWFSFTTNAAGQVVVGAIPSGGFNAVVELFSGNCGSLVSLGCKNVGGNGITDTLIRTLDANTTYYARVYHSLAGSGTNGEFIFLAYYNPVPPANDNCAGAIPLTLGNSCSSPISANTVGATQSLAGCTGTADDDVWYSFTVTGGPKTVVVDVQGNTNFNPVLQVYSGTCGTPTSLACLNSTGNAGLERYTSATPLANGTYYVRVYHFGAGIGSTSGFSICAYTPTPACPVKIAPGNLAGNINPANPINLTWNASVGTPAATSYTVKVSTVSDFSSTVINQTGITGTSYTIPAATLSASTQYYWTVLPVNANGTNTDCEATPFTFTTAGPITCIAGGSFTPATGSVDVPLNQLISWTAPGSGVAPFTYDVFFGTSPTPPLVSNDQTGVSFNPGALAQNTTYYYRVIPKDAIDQEPTGCATLSFTTLQIPANDNCAGAVTLTSSGTCVPTAGTSKFATQSNVAVCGGNADDDVWYKFTATSAFTTITVEGGTMVNPVIQLYSNAICGNTASLACANNLTGSTEVLSVNNLVVGNSYKFRVYSFGGAADAGTFTVCVTSIPDLVVATNQTISGTYGNISIEPGATATLGGALTSLNNMTVKNGATLITGSHTVTGNGTFTLEAGGTLSIGSPQGIAASGASGSIIFTNRNFSTGATYIYTGTAVSQSSGTGLPSLVENLTVNKASGSLLLTNNVMIANTLKLQSGILNVNGKTLTLRSTPSKTARLAKVESGANLSGNITVQRALGAGHRWQYFGTPLKSQTFATIQNANFAAYYTYDFATAANKGWVLVTSMAQSLPVGRGAIGFGSGNFATTGLPTIGDGAGNNAGNFDFTLGYDENGWANMGGFKGWNLLANPYPCEISWETMTRNAQTDNVFYLWNGSAYEWYQVGGAKSSANITSAIPSGQGFFVRAIDNTATLSTNENDKVSSAPIFLSGIVSNRLTITLSNDTNYTDQAFISFQENAAASYEFRKDVLKLEGDVLNIGSITPEAAILASNVMPELTSTTTIPLSVTVAQAGSYKLRVSGITTFSNGEQFFLLDKHLNIIQAIGVNGLEYSFVVTTDAHSQGNGRFEIMVLPSSVTSLSTKVANIPAQMSVFPNPNDGTSFGIALKGFEERATLQIVDMTGAVRHTEVVNTKSLVDGNMTLSNLNLAAGVYIISVTDGTNRTQQKMVVR